MGTNKWDRNILADRAVTYVPAPSAKSKARGAKKKLVIEFQALKTRLTPHTWLDGFTQDEVDSLGYAMQGDKAFVRFMPDVLDAWATRWEAADPRENATMANSIHVLAKQIRIWKFGRSVRWAIAVYPDTPARDSLLEIILNLDVYKITTRRTDDEDDDLRDAMDDSADEKTFVKGARVIEKYLEKDPINVRDYPGAAEVLKAAFLL